MATEEEKAIYKEALETAVLKEVGSFEKGLIENGDLKLERYNDSVVFYKAEDIDQEFNIDWAGASSYYRTMTKEHFDYLVSKNKVNIEGKLDYGGIAPFFNYCSNPKVFGNKTPGSHIVEFRLNVGGKAFLTEVWELEKKATGNKKLGWKDPKPENGALSIGLGQKGTWPGAKAGILFNEKIQQNKITWRLVNFKIKLPIAKESDYLNSL